MPLPPPRPSRSRQVLLDTPAATPRCYRLLVRLVDYLPKDMGEMCQTAAACGLPGALELLRREGGAVAGDETWQGDEPTCLLAGPTAT